jgi:hypothetical protein
MEEKPPGLRPPLQNSSSPRDFEPDERDIEKIRQWQHQRIEKKLRGEYESAVMHLSEVVSTPFSHIFSIDRKSVDKQQSYYPLANIVCASRGRIQHTPVVPPVPH